MDADASVPGADAAAGTDAMPATGIEGALTSADGAADVFVERVLITHVKPAIGAESAGFFVQQEASGPALYMAVDPASLSPMPAVGDTATFTITELATRDQRRQATAVRDLVVHSSDNALEAVAQELATIEDLTVAPASHASQLVTVSAATVAGDMHFAGMGYTGARLKTEQISSTANLRVRVVEAVQARLGLVEGCELSISASVLWLMGNELHVSIWDESQLASVTCPAPRVVRAAAIGSTEVVVELDRAVDPATISADAAQLTISGLEVMTARVEGRHVTLTTAAQSAGEDYTVSLAGSVTDVLGVGVAQSASTARFHGYAPRAAVRINELKANAASGCDLVELRVTQGGSLADFQVLERDQRLLVFPEFAVETNDLIIVHLNGNNPACNPGGGSSERTSVSQQPRASFGANFDTAYDWYSIEDGMAASDNVLAVVDPAGQLVDAVLATADSSGAVALTTEAYGAMVATSGAWEMVGGGVPPGGFVGKDFQAHAVPGLNEEGSMQRTDDGDDNDKGDWVGNQAITFGALNVGQSAL